MIFLLFGRFFATALALFSTSLLPEPDNNIEFKYSINHPYYVSVSELEWNSVSKQCEVSVKIFTDDFEEALKQAGTQCDLLRGKMAENNPRIFAYVEKHLQIRVNGTQIRLKILGYETDTEATWVYLEGPSPTPPVKVEITNDLLFESKKEQVNIMHLKSGENRKSFRLVNPENQCTWAVGSQQSAVFSL